MSLWFSSPGQRGTKKVLNEYGDRLVCVRYRYDEKQRKRFKTIELIIDEVPWQPKEVQNAGDTIVTIVGIRVNWGELELSKLIKRTGGRWNRERKVWELRYDLVIKLGLEDRIVDKKHLKV